MLPGAVCRSERGQNPRGDILPVAGLCRHQVQRDRGVGAAQILPVGDLPGENAGQIRQRDRVDGVRRRHQHDKRIERQNPAARGQRQVALVGGAGGFGLGGIGGAQGQRDIGLAVQQGPKPASVVLDVT